MTTPTFEGIVYMAAVLFILALCIYFMMYHESKGERRDD